MANIRSKLAQLYSLEQLSGGTTGVHRLHPLSKLAVTLIYLVCVVSHSRLAVVSLLPYLLYPALMMRLGRVPWKMIFHRTLIALPFCLFAGLSNLILDRTPLLWLGNVPITAGFVSLVSILLRTFLCVSAILILVAVTPFTRLTEQLRRLHVPALPVALVEMIYRYIGVLAEETEHMLTAYRLRSPGAKWPDIRHAGSFVGQLLVRSMDRAQRIYHAMQCRGYAGNDRVRLPQPMSGWDWLFLLLGGCGSILLCLIPVLWRVY